MISKRTAERVVPLLGALGVILTLLFPPFAVRLPTGSVLRLEYRFLLASPSNNPSTVDISLLLVEWAAILVVCVLIWLSSRAEPTGVTVGTVGPAEAQLGVHDADVSATRRAAGALPAWFIVGAILFGALLVAAVLKRPLGECRGCDENAVSSVVSPEQPVISNFEFRTLDDGEPQQSQTPRDDPQSTSYATLIATLVEVTGTVLLVYPGWLFLERRRKRREARRLQALADDLAKSRRIAAQER